MKLLTTKLSPTKLSPLQRILSGIGLITAFSMIIPLASAQTPEQKGLEISQQAKLRDIGWVDNTADMMMYLRNKQGQESIRQVKIKNLEQLNDGDKSLTNFTQPKDVKGTSF